VNPALVIAAILMIAMALTAARLFVGPTLHDRLLAAHCFALGACMLIAALAAAARRPDWADVAVALCLADFVVLAAACKFLRYRSFQTALAPLRRGQAGAGAAE
jgi:multicomponent Na+:H+ antiporter subunit F